MLFGDDMELNEDLEEPPTCVAVSLRTHILEEPPTCVAVSLRTHISLKDIWIPAELLINRQKAPDCNKDRPNIFHILTKSRTESLSIYFDSKENPNEKSLNVDEVDSPKLFFQDDIVPVDQNEDSSNSNQLKNFLELLNNESPLCDYNEEKSSKLLDVLCNENFTSEESVTCPTETVADFPIAYQRPLLKDLTKQKTQKHRNKKKNPSKKIQLADFLQTENVDGYEVEPRDEFYDNLVKQGKCPPHDFADMSQICEEFHNLPEVNSYKESSRPFLENCGGSLFEDSSLHSIKQVSMQPLADETNVSTLVLENVKCDISKEAIEILMSTYGELKNVSLEPVGKAVKVYVKLIVEHDIDWIIECLNGSEPFGASGGILKCCKL